MNYETPANPYLHKNSSSYSKPGSAGEPKSIKATTRPFEAKGRGSFSAPVPPVRERSNKRSDSLRQMKVIKSEIKEMNKSWGNSQK